MSRRACKYCRLRAREEGAEHCVRSDCRKAAKLEHKAIYAKSFKSRAKAERRLEVMIGIIRNPEALNPRFQQDKKHKPEDRGTRRNHNDDFSY